LLKKKILQIAVKTCNNIIKPDKLVPILLVFSFYLQIIKKDILAPEIIVRA
ncbi:hypothetical protein DL98DRAFT_436559, partial [Cadophora sp. DSE1049]